MQRISHIYHDDDDLLFISSEDVSDIFENFSTVCSQEVCTFFVLGLRK